MTKYRALYRGVTTGDNPRNPARLYCSESQGPGGHWHMEKPEGVAPLLTSAQAAARFIQKLQTKDVARS